MSARNSNLAMRDTPEPAVAAASRILSKAEFGRRLKALSAHKGWSQSDLARETGRFGKPIGRDSISTYIAGKTWPSPKAVKTLAACFDMEPEELLPNAALEAMEAEPSIELREAAGDPSRVLLKVNRLLSLPLAAKIVAMISAEPEAA